MEKRMGETGNGPAAGGLPDQAFGVLMGIASHGKGLPVRQEFVDDPDFPEQEVEDGVDPEQAAEEFQGQEIQGMAAADMGHFMAEDRLSIICFQGDPAIPEQAVAKGKRGSRGVGVVEADAGHPDGGVFPGKADDMDQRGEKPEEQGGGDQTIDQGDPGPSAANNGRRGGGDRGVMETGIRCGTGQDGERRRLGPAARQVKQGQKHRGARRSQEVAPVIGVEGGIPEKGSVPAEKDGRNQGHFQQVPGWEWRKGNVHNRLFY